MIQIYKTKHTCNDHNCQKPIRTTVNRRSHVQGKTSTGFKCSNGNTKQHKTGNENFHFCWFVFQNFKLSNVQTLNEAQTLKYPVYYKLLYSFFDFLLYFRIIRLWDYGDYLTQTNLSQVEHMNALCLTYHHIFHIL